jgi:serine/threonine-protein phosphatase 2A activator
MNMASGMPQLREIYLNQVLNFEIPTSKIKSDDDVQYWKTTQSYMDYRIFLRRLNQSVVGYSLPWEPNTHSQVHYLNSESTYVH